MLILLDRLLNVLSIILSGQPYHHPNSSFAKQNNLIQTQIQLQVIIIIITIVIIIIIVVVVVVVIVVGYFKFSK